MYGQWLSDVLNIREYVCMYLYYSTVRITYIDDETCEFVCVVPRESRIRHADIWRRFLWRLTLFESSPDRCVEVAHVKAHVGTHGNERSDSLGKQIFPENTCHVERRQDTSPWQGLIGPLPSDYRRKMCLVNIYLLYFSVVSIGSILNSEYAVKCWPQHCVVLLRHYVS